ncbi:tRNA uracil 4-sulfurtransferase ThiI [Thioalkalivibrio sp. AKL17]|uniref:tRNA uracil 4-sulfurtransferase ThiI n=1 Tax=Thioalkalivibrio sp. AKL17 TaxID=1158160 RepID=UPI00036405A7|nr:tRNA uracil 4-sulfurtransferase ThiI [Thioalkalivibrio sp. AKL17]
MTAESDLIILRQAPEIHLKAPGTRRHFTRILQRNLRKALEGIPHRLATAQGRLLLRTAERERALEILPRVFGLSTFSPVVAEVEPELEAIVDGVRRHFTEAVRGRTYAVRCKRQGTKRVSATRIEREAGAALNGPGKVNLDAPDVTVRIDLQEDRAWLFSERRRGAGGLPLGVQGRTLVLLSGGFDSAVAAWYMMRRGTTADFVFCNLGGATHEAMVAAIARRLAGDWAHGTRPRLYVVNFEAVVEDLRANVPGDMWQIVLKRLMYRAAEAVAARSGAEALVTGEALSQVSSQTLSNLQTIDAVATLPVLRPLIGFDKQEITDRARAIGTFELCERVPEFCALSEQPPLVESRTSRIERAEAALDPAILQQAIDAVCERDPLAVDDGPDGVEGEGEGEGEGIFVDRIPEGATVIDCQPPEAYRRWHWPGAENHPADTLLQAFADWPADREYVLYCQRGSNSAVIAERMQRAGFRARAFRGGLNRLKRQETSPLADPAQG